MQTTRRKFVATLAVLPVAAMLPLAVDAKPIRDLSKMARTGVHPSGRTNAFEYVNALCENFETEYAAIFREHNIRFALVNGCRAYTYYSPHTGTPTSTIGATLLKITRSGKGGGALPCGSGKVEKIGDHALGIGIDFAHVTNEQGDIPTALRTALIKLAAA